MINVCDDILCLWTYFFNIAGLIPQGCHTLGHTVMKTNVTPNHRRKYDINKLLSATFMSQTVNAQLVALANFVFFLSNVP